MFVEIAVFAVIVLLVYVVLKVLKVSIRIIWKLLINALAGGLVLFLVNLIPGIDVPVNLLTAVLTGIFGLPAVIVILLISLL